MPQYNLSFEQLKLDLELENWLKIEKKINIADTTCESQITELENFCGNGLHLSGRVLKMLHLNAKTES